MTISATLPPTIALEVTTEEESIFHAALADQFAREHDNVIPAELNINIKNGIATLSGTSGSTADSNMVEYLVSRITDVDCVINLITSNNQRTA